MPPASPDKEPIVYRGGWGFQIPRRHRLKLRDKLVTLTTDTGRATTYTVDHSDETDEELRIFVIGQRAVGKDEYPFPTLEEEILRLRNDLAAAGENDPKETARMEGETDDSYTARLRGQLGSLRPRRLGR